MDSVFNSWHIFLLRILYFISPFFCCRMRKTTLVFAMLVMRPVRVEDCDDLYRLAQMAGSGMTSLPANKAALKHNIEVAMESFNRLIRDKDDYFLLVMEDTETKKVIGTSGVYARTGSRQAFYAYRIMSVTHYSHSLNREARSGLLHLTNDYTDCSEVGTLFLDPEYRGNGHWLSRCRYMLMAQHPQRFAPDVIAELRGVIDERGESPVWNAIGAPFFGMTYDEADRLCGVGSNQFITELMPKYPIYTNMLSEAARMALGRPHQQTKRAMDLLLAEGFVYENLIDIFDGGPLVRAQIDQIKSVKAVQTLEVTFKEPEGDAKAVMCANRSLDDFRLVYEPMSVTPNRVSMPAEVGQMLNVREGNQVMVIE